MLLKCFITYLRYIRRLVGAYGIIYELVMVHMVPFLSRLTLNDIKVLGVVGYPLSMGNGMIYCEERFPLLMKCFITFLRYIRRVTGASGIIYDHIVIHNMSFLVMPALKFHTKCQMWGTLFAHKMG